MRKNSFIVIVTAFTAMLLAVAVEAKEITMRSPPLKMDEHERVLNSDEVTALRCTHDARRIVSDRDGIVMDSERVSHSDRFGYVYRYDLVQLLDDERGATYKSHTVFLVWTQDCETFELATHPMYQLPKLEDLR
jgi:hypothetical protein